MKTPIRALVSLSLALTSVVACVGLPGRPATFEVHAVGGAATFTTSAGWDVTLRVARIALGPLYVYAPEEDAMASIERALLPVARAHGGEDPFGHRPVRAEWLEQVTVDALSQAPAVLGVADGTAGRATDVTLLIRPSETNDSELHAWSAWVEGSATQGDVRVDFVGGVTLPTEGLGERIEGLALDAVVDDAGALVIEVHPERWLDEARFERLATTVDDAVIDVGSQVALAWRLGLKSPGAFVARWEEGSEEE